MTPATHLLRVADDLAVLAGHLGQRHGEWKPGLLGHVAADVRDVLRQDDVWAALSAICLGKFASGPQHAHHHAQDSRSNA